MKKLAIALGTALLASTAIFAQTTSTVTGFDNGTGTINTDNGDLTSANTFVAGDVLLVDEAVLNGFTFDGWNLANLTIKAGAGGDDHFKGITFAAATTVSGLTMDSIWSFRGNTTVFAGGTSNVTFTGSNIFRDADDMLRATDWNGAIIGELGAYSMGSTTIGSMDMAGVDFGGATLTVGMQFLRKAFNRDQISWEGVMFNISTNQIWRSENSSSSDLGADFGVMARNWNNSTINAAGGGLFDCFHTNGFSGTYTFNGADVNGAVFAGTGNNQFAPGTVLDFGGADVSDLTGRDISTFANLAVNYNPGTTIFGTYTEAQALLDGWNDVSALSFSVVYRAGANGSISGTTNQTVLGGGSSTAVTAVPDSGYIFVDWSDAVTNSMRQDVNVQADIDVTANFMSEDLIPETMTVTGFGGGTIQTDKGDLTSASTFVPGDVLVVDESDLNGFTFDGWNLSNLTIQAGAGSDDHFKGITFAANTVVNGLTMDASYSFRNSPEAVFAGGTSNVTFTGTYVFRYANEMLAATDWNGATIYANSGNGYDIGSIDMGAVNVDFSGATIYAGTRFIRGSSNRDQISWEGVTFNITASQIWRDDNSSAYDLDANKGVMGRNWNNSTVNATGGGLFDSYNRNGFSGTYTFDGADVNGDLFTGTSNNEIYQPAIVDFSGADVGDLAARNISSLTNLTVVYNPTTTLFGTYTVEQAIADGWEIASDVDPYDAWVAGYPGLTNSAPNFDQEPDGMDNLMEYALGADPTVADADTYLPNAITDGSNLYYVYRRQNPKDPVLTYAVLSSDNLVIEPITNATAEVGVSGVTDGFESVTNALPTTLSTGFMQLKVERAAE